MTNKYEYCIILRSELARDEKEHIDSIEFAETIDAALEIGYKHIEYVGGYPAQGEYQIYKICNPDSAVWLKYGNKRTCSQCEFTYFTHVTNGGNFKYCPKCGAHMEVK